MHLSDLQKGYDTPGDHGLPLDSEPDWLDKERFYRGRAFVKKNIFPISMGIHLSLVVGFCVKSVLDAVVWTNQSSTPQSSRRRYLLTYKHFTSWVFGDVWDKDNAGYKSIRLVRRIHGKVARSMRDSTGKLYVSQYDMSLVQCGFMGMTVTYPDKLGLHHTAQDLEDFVHFWRGLAYILGIADENNICSGSLEDTVGICREILSEVIYPALRNPPDQCVPMAEAYLEGMNAMHWWPVHSWTADSTVMISYILEQPRPSMSLLDLLRFCFMLTLLKLCQWWPGFIFYANRGARVAIDDMLKKYT